MKDWQINIILILLCILTTGMFYTISLLLEQKQTQHDVIKSALIEALDETYDTATE